MTDKGPVTCYYTCRECGEVQYIGEREKQAGYLNLKKQGICRKCWDEHER